MPIVHFPPPPDAFVPVAEFRRHKKAKRIGQYAFSGIAPAAVNAVELLALTRAEMATMVAKRPEVFRDGLDELRKAARMAIMATAFMQDAAARLAIVLGDLN